jgi:hypothetical protein
VKRWGRVALTLAAVAVLSGLVVSPAAHGITNSPPPVCTGSKCAWSPAPGYGLPSGGFPPAVGVNVTGSRYSVAATPSGRLLIDDQQTIDPAVLPTGCGDGHCLLGEAVSWDLGVPLGGPSGAWGAVAVHIHYDRNNVDSTNSTSPQTGAFLQVIVGGACQSWSGSGTLSQGVHDQVVQFGFSQECWANAKKYSATYTPEIEILVYDAVPAVLGNQAKLDLQVELVQLGWCPQGTSWSACTNAPT